jgi:hypothetical protein
MIDASSLTSSAVARLTTGAHDVWVAVSVALARAEGRTTSSLPDASGLAMKDAAMATIGASMIGETTIEGTMTGGTMTGGTMTGGTTTGGTMTEAVETARVQETHRDVLVLLRVRGLLLERRHRRRHPVRLRKRKKERWASSRLHRPPMIENAIVAREAVRARARRLERGIETIRVTVNATATIGVVLVLESVGTIDRIHHELALEL